METPIIGGEQGPTQGAGSHIKDTNTANFMADVVEASRQVPVIVDFWAPWCGPCKQLTPLLEAAVKAARGKVKLVKLNVDENQQLAAQMRIQSIPAVYAFVDGQPVDGFMGGIPESQIKAFIERLIAAAPNSGDDDTAALLAVGQESLAAKDLGTAAQAFAQVLQIDRENTAAIAGLAKCQIESGDLQNAKNTLSLTPPSKMNDADILSAQAALELAQTPVDTGEIGRLEDAVGSNPKDHQARLNLAVALNAAGRREDALEHLLTIIRRDRNWNDEAARRQLLQFFDAWGPKDELTVSGRRQLASVLFS